MEDAPEGEDSTLKFLRRLVTTLTIVMIVGFIVLIAFLVTRFPDTAPLSLPDQITLPDGTEAEAFTVTEKWYAVVTTSGLILVFDRATGDQIQTINLISE